MVFFPWCDRSGRGIGMVYPQSLTKIRTIIAMNGAIWADRLKSCQRRPIVARGVRNTLDHAEFWAEKREMWRRFPSSKRSVIVVEIKAEGRSYAERRICGPTEAGPDAGHRTVLGRLKPLKINQKLRLNSNSPPGSASITPMPNPNISATVPTMKTM